MNYRDELMSAAEAMASNPKVLATVAGATSSLGVATWNELISGVLSGAAIMSGIIATILLGRVHWVSYKNQVIQNKIFRKQLRDLGGDPDSDEG